MNPEMTEETSRPLLATPETPEIAAAEAGILGDDALLGGPVLEGEALEEEMRRQVEYFLSREYLSTDPYLVSHMNSDMYFPITTVATLTTHKVDLEVLVKTLKKSAHLTVNESGTMVKPNFKIQRNTLILRDIPSSAKVEEVQGIFQGETCPPVTGIRPDIGDCWFVTFNTEDDALKALDFVRGRTFRDAPVKARIKSENLLRSFTYFPPAPAGGDLGMKMQQQQSHVPPYGGYGYYYPPQQYAQPHHVQPDHQQDHRRQRAAGGSGGHRQPGAAAASTVAPRRGEMNRTNKYGNGVGPAPAVQLQGAPGGPVLPVGASGTVPAVHAPSQTNNRSNPVSSENSDNRKQRRTGTRGNRKQDGAPTNSTSTSSTSTKSSQSQQPPQLGLAHFPPLSSQPQNKSKHVGYTKDFTKFTKKQLIDIVSSTTVPNQRPSSFPTECLATLDEPNTQLIITPASPLDAPKPVQDNTAQEGAAPASPLTTLPSPTPTQPTITMASLVATHKDKVTTPAPVAQKKPQTKAKATQPKTTNPSPVQAKGNQNKKASPPPKKQAPPKKAEESSSQSPQQASTTSANATPAASSPAPATNTPSAAPAAAAPAASSAASTATSSPAATHGASAAPSGSSTPTYAQQAAKAAAAKPAHPKEKKEPTDKKEDKKEDRKEDKESASA